MAKDRIVVTQHQAFYQFLINEGLIEPGTRAVGKATLEDIRGKHVFGTLPLNLAVYAASITVAVVDTPPWKPQLAKLTVADWKQFCTSIETFTVHHTTEVPWVQQEE